MKKLTIVLFSIAAVMISSPVFPADLIDFGAMWKAWGAEGQHAYFWGFVDGKTKSILTAYDEILSSATRGQNVPKNFVENIEKKTATLHDERKLRDVITNLYKDPANSYIWIADMIYIARDSLNGADVSNALLKARKRLDNHL